MLKLTTPYQLSDAQLSTLDDVIADLRLALDDTEDESISINALRSILIGVRSHHRRRPIMNFSWFWPALLLAAFLANVWIPR